MPARCVLPRSPCWSGCARGLAVTAPVPPAPAHADGNLAPLMLAYLQPDCEPSVGASGLGCSVNISASVITRVVSLECQHQASRCCGLGCCITCSSTWTVSSTTDSAGCSACVRRVLSKAVGTWRLLAAAAADDDATGDRDAAATPLACTGSTEPRTVEASGAAGVAIASCCVAPLLLSARPGVSGPTMPSAAAAAAARAATRCRFTMARTLGRRDMMLQQQ